MFKAISWGQFASVLLVLLLLYYTYVAVVYYRTELLRLLKGKQGVAIGDALVSSRASLVGRGPLIAKPASTVPAPSPVLAVPATLAGTIDETPDQLVAEATQEGSIPEELPDLDLAAIEVLEKIDVEIKSYGCVFDDNFINFNHDDEVGSGSAYTNDTDLEFQGFEPGFTIGISQLGNYLERAAAGQLTQAQLVEQEPGLEDTDLLLAFYQSSTKKAHRTTSQLYAGVAEPSFG